MSSPPGQKRCKNATEVKLWGRFIYAADDDISQALINSKNQTESTCLAGVTRQINFNPVRRDILHWEKWSVDSYEPRMLCYNIIFAIIYQLLPFSVKLNIEYINGQI